MIRLFISHSSRDEELAGLLVELFRAGLELPPSEIRCTSVDGYRLPIGADTADQLRSEILEAQAFLGLVSKAALGSSYVLFELGARWGARLHLAPLLAAGMEPSSLPSPVSGKNALRADRAEDLQQMLHDVAETLGLQVRNPSLVQKYIGAITRQSERIEHESRKPENLANSGSEKKSQSVGVSDYPLTRSRVEGPVVADDIIERMCAQRWPDDYRMRASCIAEQRAAHGELQQEPPADIPLDVFLQIRGMCRKRWPEDFRMRVACEQEQFSAWRELKKGTSRG